MAPRTPSTPAITWSGNASTAWGARVPARRKSTGPEMSSEPTIRGARRSQERHRRDERTEGHGQDAPDAQDDERQALERVVREGAGHDREGQQAREPGGQGSQADSHDPALQRPRSNDAQDGGPGSDQGRCGARDQVADGGAHDHEGVTHREQHDTPPMTSIPPSRPSRPSRPPPAARRPEGALLQLRP